MPTRDTNIRGRFCPWKIPKALPVLWVWVNRRNPASGKESRYTSNSRTRYLVNWSRLKVIAANWRTGKCQERGGLGPGLSPDLSVEAADEGAGAPAGLAII